MEQIYNKISTEIDRITSQNNLQYVMSKDMSRLTRDLERTKQKLKKLVEVSMKRRVSVETKETIMQAMREYKTSSNKLIATEKVNIRSLSKTAQKELVQRVQEKIVNELKTQIDIIFQNLRAKVSTLKLLQSEAELQMTQFKSAVRGRSIGDVVETQIGPIRTGLNKAQIQQSIADNLSGVWNQLGRRYGNAGFIIYNSTLTDAPSYFTPSADVRGKRNYPLVSYIRQKIETVNTEAKRETITQMSARNRIYTVKFNQNGTKDSCRLWENKVVFISQPAKEEFLSRYPEFKAARKWATVDDVKNDASHMMGWNCRHFFTPYPIQYMDSVGMKDEVSGNKMPKVPKKINEYQFQKRAGL